MVCWWERAPPAAVASGEVQCQTTRSAATTSVCLQRIPQLPPLGTNPPREAAAAWT
jgi:hypothetical protein